MEVACRLNYQRYNHSDISCLFFLGQKSASLPKVRLPTESSRAFEVCALGAAEKQLGSHKNNSLCRIIPDVLYLKPARRGPL